MRQSGGCRTTFYFDKSGAVYICVARYNEYVNFGDENGIAFYSFYFYASQLYCIYYRPTILYFVQLSIHQGTSRESNSAPLCTACPLTWIDLLYDLVIERAHRVRHRQCPAVAPGIRLQTETVNRRSFQSSIRYRCLMAHSISTSPLSLSDTCSSRLL